MLPGHNNSTSPTPPREVVLDAGRLEILKSVIHLSCFIKHCDVQDE